MRNYLLLPLLFALGSVFTQEAAFTVNVNNDSILLGNRFSVTFSLQNGQGEDFFFPEFNGFVKVGGPNMSSQMNIINGAVKQSVQYTYFLEAHEVGDYYIEPASVKVGDSYLETPPLLVRVFPNPEGIIQSPPTPARSYSPFGGSFFDQDLDSPGSIFNQDLLGDDFFQQFFQQSPFGQMVPPADSLQQNQPKKRKTTRI
ncbi:BatD family protein [Lewinella sp. LCG006]|uniref:BatD family protein n=1 Tax=Lewinella sp. LCG006 TaxID=3231911 RepID=UPI00345F42D4